MQTTISLRINGRAYSVTTEAERPLLDVLREDLHLTGTKYGCGEGQCGACTVLVNGRRERSCLLPVAEAGGREITTIEGLARGGELHPVQRAFMEENAAQCGYCTPGMILSAVALLREKPAAADADIITWMHGQICRCCGYPAILRAVRRSMAAGEVRP